MEDLSDLPYQTRTLLFGSSITKNLRPKFLFI